MKNFGAGLVLVVFLMGWTITRWWFWAGVIATILLVGCGGGDYSRISDDAGYWISPATGMIVENVEPNPATNAELDQWYIEVAQCMGIDPVPVGPMVRYTDVIDGNPELTGRIYYPDLIVIRRNPTVDGRRRTPKHEFIHYLGVRDHDFSNPIWNCQHD